MEPNKLETQIKEQLNAREIKPSETAWDRLDSMLAVAENKKSKKMVFWSFQKIAIAASFILFGTTIWFFNQNKLNTNAKENTIVTNEQVTNDKVDTNQEIESTGRIESEIIQNSTTIKTVVSNQKRTILNLNNTVVVKKETKNNNKTLIAEKIQNTIESKTSLQPEISNAIVTKEVITKKPEYINAEELLASVEIPSKSKSNIKINPAVLLSQVDSELEYSFRQKIINKIEKSVQSTRVALANRNQN